MPSNSRRWSDLTRPLEAEMGPHRAPGGDAGGCGFSTLGRFVSQWLSSRFLQASPQQPWTTFAPTCVVRTATATAADLPPAPAWSHKHSVRLPELTVITRHRENGLASWRRAFLHEIPFNPHDNSGLGNGLPGDERRGLAPMASYSCRVVKPHF